MNAFLSDFTNTLAYHQKLELKEKQRLVRFTPLVIG